MREVQGYPLPLGVQISKDRVNFSIAVPADKDCQLLLYRTGRKKPCRQFDMKPMIGEVRCIALEDIEPGDYEYNYLINKEVVTDPYVKAIAGKERWGVKKELSEHEIRDGTGDADEAERIICGQIDKELPVPYLMLRHLNTEKYKDFIWHWFLVVGYEKEKHETWIDVATYGEKVRLNLKDLWKTGCEEKGGIVIYEIKEQKKN